MLRKVILEGRLAEKFGPHYNLDIETPGEVIHALGILVEGFTEEFFQGFYQIVVGENNVRLGDSLRAGLGTEPIVKIVPVVGGGKGGGIGGVFSFIGKPLAAVFSGGLDFFQDVFKPPKRDDIENSERPDDRPSFLFNGSVNVAEQGMPVAICAGRRIRRAGSVVLSAGIRTEQI